MHSPRFDAMPHPRAVLVAFLLPFAMAPAQDAQRLQKFVDDAIKDGGGEVMVPRGTYVLPRGLMIKDGKQIAIIGVDRERCVLKLPPLAFAQCGQDAAA